MCPVLDPAMLTTVNFFHGNVFYIVRRAKLAWLLLARHWAFLGIQDGGHHHIGCMDISNCWSWWHTGSCNTSFLECVRAGNQFLEFFWYWVKVKVKSEVINLSAYESPTRTTTQGIQNWTHLCFKRKLNPPKRSSFSLLQSEQDANWLSQFHQNDI